MSAVTLVGGLCVLAAAWWVRPIVVADRALARGDVERAVQQYGLSRGRLDQTLVTRSLFPRLADLVAGNELSLQYSLRRYERILEITAGLETASGPASFWTGCALYDKALVQSDRDAKLSMMSDAHQAFRRALEASPGDFDARYNYEITGRLLSVLREQPEASVDDVIKLLRERGPQPRDPRRTG